MILFNFFSWNFYFFKLTSKYTSKKITLKITFWHEHFCIKYKKKKKKMAHGLNGKKTADLRCRNFWLIWSQSLIHSLKKIPLTNYSHLHFSFVFQAPEYHNCISGTRIPQFLYEVQNRPICTILWRGGVK